MKHAAGGGESSPCFPIKGEMNEGKIVNKEQIRHWADVLKDVATGQFLFFGGKNLYLYSKSNDFDWVVLMISGVIYLIFHGIIHLILSELED